MYRVLISLWGENVNGRRYRGDNIPWEFGSTIFHHRKILPFDWPPWSAGFPLSLNFFLSAELKQEKSFHWLLKSVTQSFALMVNCCFSSSEGWNVFYWPMRSKESDPLGQSRDFPLVSPVVLRNNRVEDGFLKEKEQAVHVFWVPLHIMFQTQIQGE